jgi:hypothetical protein
MEGGEKKKANVIATPKRNKIQTLNVQIQIENDMEDYVMKTK